jgi:hypothetical protein
MIFRRIVAVGILGAIVVSGTTDLGACGDKFLRIGRSGRFRGYAAVHPASILIYIPVKAEPSGIKALEDLLKRAGHTSRSVKNGASLPEAFEAAHFDLVIAAYADAGRIRSQLGALPSHPGLLPVLHNPTKTLAAEAAREYPFLLETHLMTAHDALAEIDDLMAERLKAGAVAAR